MPCAVAAPAFVSPSALVGRKLDEDPMPLPPLERRRSELKDGGTSALPAAVTAPAVPSAAVAAGETATTKCEGIVGAAVTLTLTAAVMAVAKAVGD